MFRIQGRRLDGKKQRWSKQMSGFLTKEDAMAAEKAMAKAFYDQRDACQKAVPDRVVWTVTDMMGGWQEEQMFLRLSPVTVGNNQGWFSRYCASIQDKTVCEVTRQDIQMLLSTACKQDGSPLAASTIRELHRGLNAMFNYGIRIGIISANPCANIQLPKAKPAEYPIYTMEQIKLLLETLRDDKDPLYWPVALTARLGLRHGEALGIRWNDINMETGEIKIAHSLIALNGKCMLKEPKTEGSQASVYCSEELLAELREYRAQREADGTYKLGDSDIATPVPRSKLDPHEFVCLNKSGGIFTQRYSLELFHKVLDRLKLPQITWHALRHMFATLLLAMNLDIAAISKGLRHSSIKTTSDVYVATTESALRRLTSTFDEALRLPPVAGKSRDGSPPAPEGESQGTVTINEDGGFTLSLSPEARKREGAATYGLYLRSADA